VSGAVARRRARTTSYVTSVCVLGLALTVAALAGRFGDLDRLGSPGLLVLVGFAIAGEVKPINISWGNNREELTTSTAFVVAVLLAYGTPQALLAQLAASVVSDVIVRKALWKVAFNAAQYAVSLLAAAGAFWAVSPDQLGTSTAIEASSIPALVATSATFFSVNAGLIAVLIALPQGFGVLGHLRRGLPFQIAIAAGQFALAPVLALAVETQLWLVSVLVVPLIAVARGASASAKNEYQALHDGLTGLPNRTFLHDRIEEALDTAATKSGREQVAVLLIDLDGFKEVNDTLGHHVGDDLLRAVGTRLQETAGPNINVARLGGDEFAAVFPLTDATHAGAFAERLVSALEEPFVVDDVRLDIEGSVGIALYPGHASDRDSLLQRADVAMYRAKQLRTRVETYDPEFDPSSPRRLALLGELRHAIPNGELVLHYQPKIDLRTLTVVGVEALVRWHHPERGFTPPDEFIPLAERTGLITPLTDWVTQAALAQHGVWREQGLDVGVAVNVSVRNLHDPAFADRIAASLDRWDVPASRLKLEITEGTLMADPRRVMEVLEELHRMGVSLALDDFGTGYSSLAYLKRLPVRELKIDRSFVMHMTEDPDDSAIVRTTIDLARSLGLHVVAEGVENQDAMELLAMFGCHHAQGYYISKPLPAEAATSFLHGSARTGPAVRGATPEPPGGLVLPWTIVPPAVVPPAVVEPAVVDRSA
jgi:diguanylate cyclase (GGDEF)-like protein